MEQLGAVWSCVELCGAVWSCMELCGAVWSCVELYGAAWSCMEVPAGDPRGVRILAGAVCVYNYNEWRGAWGEVGRHRI